MYNVLVEFRHEQVEYCVLTNHLELFNTSELAQEYIDELRYDFHNKQYASYTFYTPQLFKEVLVPERTLRKGIVMLSVYKV